MIIYLILKSNMPNIPYKFHNSKALVFCSLSTYKNIFSNRLTLVRFSCIMCAFTNMYYRYMFPLDARSTEPVTVATLGRDLCMSGSERRSADILMVCLSSTYLNLKKTL